MNPAIRFVLSVLPLGAVAGAPAATAQSASAPPDPAANPCQRTCLEGWVDKYLAAMKAHNPDPQLFATDLKFTENGIRLPFGHEGLWYDMADVGAYKFYVPDIETQQVAFIGTVKEQGRTSATGAPASPTTVALVLRLKVRDGRITEIEQLAIRPDVPLGSTAPAPSRFALTGQAIEAMRAPDPSFSEALPANDRPSREQLIRVANFYFSGLSHNDGKGYYPFTDDCVRYENGIDVLAGRPGADGKPGLRQSCKGQFENALKGVVSRVRDRRFVAVDRERGIVFAFAFFDHFNINWTWQLGELFQIQGGKIRRIEAAFHRAPFGTPSGWSTYEQSMSEDVQSVR